MEIRETSIPGCREIVPPVFRDERGSFEKFFHRETFARLGLATDFAEEYHTWSHRGVVRGLHFQLPPHDLTKLVTCLAGEVLDVILDLRVGSPTYGRHAALPLSGERGTVIVIPPGLAHGFCVTTGPALMLYKVTTAYAPDHDTGIRWDSAGIIWPDLQPILSDRDRGFVPLEEFVSPFRFREEGC